MEGLGQIETREEGPQMKAWEYFLARLAAQEIGRSEREYEREAEASVQLVERICGGFLQAVEHDPNRSRDQMLFNAGGQRTAGILADKLGFPVAGKLGELSHRLLQEALGPDATKGDGEKREEPKLP